MEWRNELYELLDVFDRQTLVSLGKIKLAFKRRGYAFNDEFKQYFLRVSTDRIKNTYDEFEFNSMLEDDDSCDPDENISMADKYETMDSVHVRIHDVNDEPDEIVELSDEEDQPGYGMKLELLEELATHDHGVLQELYDADHFEDNENYYADELTYPKSLKCQKRSIMDHIKNGTDVATNANETEVDDDILLTDVDRYWSNYKRKKQTTIAASNNQRNNIANAKNKNNVGKIGKRSDRQTDSASKKTIPSMQSVKKRFKCELCEYSSIHMCSLKRHIRIHTGEKRYRCDFCHKGFTQGSKMKMHKVTHTDVIPFHCRGCFTGFLQKAEREAHEKVCKNRRYECHICKKMVTAQKTNLILHVRIHSGEKPFRCEICLKRFNMKGNLKKHLDTIHTRVNF